MTWLLQSWRNKSETSSFSINLLFRNNILMIINLGIPGEVVTCFKAPFLRRLLGLVVRRLLCWAVKLKTQAFQAWLAQRSPEAADSSGGPEGLQLRWSPKQKPGCWRSLERLWRRTSVGLKEVLEKQGFARVQEWGITADPDWGYC